MNCLIFLLGGILAIGVGLASVIYSDKSRSEQAFYGNTQIKVAGGVVLMAGILVIIGSLIGLQSGCQPP